MPGTCIFSEPKREMELMRYQSNVSNACTNNENDKICSHISRRQTKPRSKMFTKTIPSYLRNVKDMKKMEYQYT